MYTFRNGVIRSGVWDGGNLKTPRPPETDAVVEAVQVHQKVRIVTLCVSFLKLLVSVQAARKTADAAVHLRRVDEKVDGAVAAANKAATAARVAAVKAVENRIH